MTVYVVTAIHTNADGSLRLETVGEFDEIVEAQKAARRAAGRNIVDSEPYGPSSFCYVGDKITAVVAW